MCCFRDLFVLGLLAGNARAALEIIPAATWTATNTGEHVQAHGHGIIEVDGTYYMIGEDKTQGTVFQNVNCYSSTNLVEWTYEGALLSQTAEPGDLGPDRVVERPKVIFNDNTGKYVLYLHIDSRDYKEAKVGVATGDTVCGQYEYHGSFRPLDFQSRDMGLFKDEDGAGYLLSEDRDYGTRIIALSEDYLNVTEVTHGWEYAAESPAIIKRNGHYFVFGSHLTGWDPNDNVYTHAESLSGPWSDWTEFAPVGSNTHGSQVNYILPLGTENAIYMGDRWIESNLAASTYVWLPLTISGTDVTLDWHDSWSLDLDAGTWSAPSDTNRVEGEGGELGGGAQVISCGECSGGQAAGYVGGEDSGTVTYNSVMGSGSRATVAIKYRNGDTEPRHATVTVNDTPYDVAFLSTRHRSDIAGTSSLHCDLADGDNTIVFSSSDGSWGPDVDELVVGVY